MTEKKAIEFQKAFYMMLDDKQAKEACKTAISALEEIQQYRSIGTVEECKSLASISSMAEKCELEKIIDEWLKYSKIGTVEECREAVKKQKTMKVNEVHVDEYN